MKLSEISHVLEGLAPLSLAESWDKVGLQIGEATRAVRRAMLCIDLTPEVMAEAVAKRVGLVVSYHPLIFKPLEGLREDHRATWQEKVAVEAVRRGIAVYSPHTALDAASGGVNDWLCAGLGKGRAAAIKVHHTERSEEYKIVTFVPHSHADRVRQALFSVGAGGIGRYWECSFNSTGQGTFRPGDGAKPFLGRRGQLETVDEVRIEMLCRYMFLGDAIAALRRAHPYEEPAFDVFPRHEPTPSEYETIGQGRTIMLDEAISLGTLVARIKRHLKVSRLEVARPARIGLNDAGKIRIVDVCAGSGGAMVPCSTATDACVTGEMKHHDVLKAVQQGTVVILAGHTQTERPYLPVYRRRIIKAGGSGGGRGVEWLISRADKPPGKMV